MRQIKFRVWSKIKKQFIQNWWIGEIKNANFNNGLIGFNTDTFNTEDYIDSEDFHINNCVIQQFTGLIDKNNKEIYEGDIVKTDPEHITLKLTSDPTEYTAGIVKFIRQGFNIGQKNIGSVEMHEYAACDCCPCGLEIIGNIFENKELLN